MHTLCTWSGCWLLRMGPTPAATLRAARHLYALLSGLLLVYFPFGMGITQVALPLVVTYAAMALAPRHCGAIAWLNMAFLIYL